MYVHAPIYILALIVLKEPMHKRRRRLPLIWYGILQTWHTFFF